MRLYSIVFKMKLLIVKYFVVKYIWNQRASIII